MSETVTLERSPSREALFDRARRRRKFMKEAAGLIDAELALLSGPALENYRSGIVSTLLEPIEYAGKCASNNKTPQALAGKSFAEKKISFRVNRFPEVEREGIYRKLLRFVMCEAKGGESNYRRLRQ
jgi:hypothetical protein